MGWEQVGQIAAQGGMSYIGRALDARIADKRTHESYDFNQALQKYWDSINYQRGREYEDRSYERSKEFAKNSIKWRVEDAINAGLHPLYALGGSGNSYTPPGTMIGGGDSGSMPMQSSGSDYASAFDAMGQDISRALGAGMTAKERAMEDLRLKLLESQIKETDLRSLEITNRLANKGQNDLNSSPWPAGADQVSIQPVQKTSQSPDDPSRVAGEHAAWQKTYITPDLIWDLPYSQGEGPFESLESVLAQALTLYKNLWYNRRLPYHDTPDSWRSVERRARQQRQYKEGR